MPYSPVHFAELLETKTFTNGADKAIVSKLYARGVGCARFHQGAQLGLHPVRRWRGVRLGATLVLCHHVERLHA